MRPILNPGGWTSLSFLTLSTDLGPTGPKYKSRQSCARFAFVFCSADVAQAEGQLAMARAGLKKTRQSLDYCTIKSPVKGVVIDRRVNIGQTVMASLNAPSVFLIAKDLRRLQLWVAVNEADIGNIHRDQVVTFTADAFPAETFEGRVGKIRLNANTTQNVVSYIVEVNTDNSNGKLLPYLSANARFIVDEHRQVLMAPNAALKWRPRPSSATGGSPGKAEALMHSPQPAGISHSKEETAGSGVVWVSESGCIRQVKVRVGLSDGSWTEIQGDEIQEGKAVVVEERMESAGKDTDALVNPLCTEAHGTRGRPLAPLESFVCNRSWCRGFYSVAGYWEGLSFRWIRNRRAPRRVPGDGSGRIRGPHGLFGLREDDAHERAGVPGPTDFGPVPSRWGMYTR